MAFALTQEARAQTVPNAGDPRPTNPIPTGRLLKSQTFGNEPQYDGKWYTFGPLNSLEWATFSSWWWVV